jgi:hypothetical protein
MLIAQIHTISHHLICEIGIWVVPKEEWEKMSFLRQGIDGDRMALCYRMFSV